MLADVDSLPFLELRLDRNKQAYFLSGCQHLSGRRTDAFRWPSLLRHFFKCLPNLSPLEQPLLLALEWLVTVCYNRKTALSTICTNVTTGLQLAWDTRGRRVFWEGSKFFKLCSTHFFRRGETFSRGFAPLHPLFTGLRHNVHHTLLSTVAITVLLKKVVNEHLPVLSQKLSFKMYELGLVSTWIFYFGLLFLTLG